MTQSTLPQSIMIRMLDLFNHRQITIERDGYGQQSFEVHFAVKEVNSTTIGIDAFEKTASIIIDTATNVVSVQNNIFKSSIVSKFNTSYDSLLYTYHLICVLANSEPQNAMFVLTVLPTVFTVLLKIYEELPDTTDKELGDACKTILTHTQDICFDHNAIVISRKKL